MRAMILCAGLGTRLRPLTLQWPKPALPLLGQPLLRYNLALLSAAGVREIGINTHHLPEAMRDCAEHECARLGLRLTVVHEPTIQGTGGGIRGLRRFLEQDDFIVLNGDILLGVALWPIIQAHRAGGAAATMVLLPMPENERYAAVEVDRDLRIRRIAGHGPGGPGLTPWHFSGVHVMSPAVFDFMAAEGPEDINRAVYVRMIEAGLVLRAHVTAGYWSDVGTPARYLATQADLLGGRVHVEAFPGASPFEAGGARTRGEGIVPPSLVDGAAEIGKGALVGPGAYVGCGARVGEGARLRRCAVLEETLVESGEELVDLIAWGPHRLTSA
jgi:mannose-1-phosphate guanylyltransferase